MRVPDGTRRGARARRRRRLRRPSSHRPPMACVSTQATSRQGMARASAWLAASPPARREIVVISDLQRGGLASSSTLSHGRWHRRAVLPVGRRAETSSFEGAGLLGAGDVAPREQTIEATADTTAVGLRSSVRGEAPGLRLIGPPDAERSSHACCARSRSPARSRARPSNQSPSSWPVRHQRQHRRRFQPGWMLRTVLRLLNDPASSVSPRVTVQSSAVADPTPWITLASNPRGQAAGSSRGVPAPSYLSTSRRQSTACLRPKLSGRC